MPRFGLGWIPDTPDIRDEHYQFSAAPEVLQALPQRVDLRAAMPPILDQARTNTCVTQATGNAFRQANKKSGNPDYMPSRLFAYWNACSYEGTAGRDVGTTIRSGIKAWVEYGGPRETLWPFIPSKVNTRPPQSVYDVGKDHQAIVYRRVQQNADQLCAALAQQFPVAFGAMIYGPFQDIRGNRDSDVVVPMPTRHMKKLGGHAMLIVGYFWHNGKLYFIVMNSWSERWGWQGFCVFPAEYILNDNLSADFWVMEQVETTETPQPEPGEDDHVGPPTPQPADSELPNWIQMLLDGIHVPARAGDTISFNLGGGK